MALTRRTTIAVPACLAAALSSAGCATRSDPAEGGFASGVAGVAGGGYERRVEAREADLDAERTRQAALQDEAAGVEAEAASLEAEIASAEAELADLKRELVALRYRTESAGSPPDPELSARVETAVATDPGGATPEERLANLSRAVSDARALVDTLARLGG